MTRTEVRIRQQEMFPNQTLPTICLDVRQALNGAADPWNEEDLRKTYQLLVDVVATWEKTAFDEDVYIDSAILTIVWHTKYKLKKVLATV